MRRPLALPLVLPGLLAASLITAAPATAATVRYASATGSGTTCTAGAPCSLTEAVNNALNGDEIVVKSGTYVLSVPLASSKNNLKVHGEAGQPRPSITSSAATALSLTGASEVVSDLEITHTGTATGLQVFSVTSTVERVVVRSTGSRTCSGGTDQSLWRNAVCMSTSAGGVAFFDAWGGSGSATVRLRNVTAIATGSGSQAIMLGTQANGMSLTFDLRDVIARGTSVDVGTTNSGTGTTTVNLATSNYATAVGGPSVTAPGTAGNQTSAPLFADASYRQAPTSPTVDAGSTDAYTATTDLDGRARVQGAAIDIGAFEHVPPPAPVAPDTAVLSGPKKKTTKHKARFTFGGAGAATFTCQLDKKAAIACPASYAVKVKKKGKHVLTVTATSAQGLVDPTPAVYRWKIR